MEAVSWEPVSGSNSLLTGKRTGNFANSSPIEGKDEANNAASTGLYEQNSLRNRTGKFFRANRENFLRDQGILIRGAGTLVNRPFLACFFSRTAHFSRPRSSCGACTTKAGLSSAITRNFCASSCSSAVGVPPKSPWSATTVSPCLWARHRHRETGQTFDELTGQRGRGEVGNG